MITRAVILLALATGIHAECKCHYENQTYSTSWPTFFVQGGFGDLGNPCPVSCSYILRSGNDTMGVGNYISLQWDNDPGSYITFYNCWDGGDNGCHNVTAIRNMTKDSKNDTNLASSTPTVKVDVFTTGQTSILVTFTQVPLCISTPTSTTMAPYTGDLLKNPALISNDLMFMVDGGKNLNGSTVFEEMKNFTASIVDKIATAVIAGDASTVGTAKTRLALNSLSPINWQAILTAWQSNADSVSTQIRNLPQIGTLFTTYKTALEPLTYRNNSPFSIYNEDLQIQNSRPYAQRMLIVVSNVVPSDLTDLKEINFEYNDIHPVFIAYKLPNDDVKTIQIALNESLWSVFSATDDNKVSDFVNQYLLATEGNKVCASIIDDGIKAMTAQNSNAINSTCIPDDCSENVLSIPKDYKLTKTPDTTWSPMPQVSRYCNWQKQQINFMGLTNKATCFTVYYELESEKDTLKFYPTDDYFRINGTEFVMLSGLDVSGSVIRLKGNVALVFETNENDVRGGFYLTYKPC